MAVRKNAVDRTILRGEAYENFRHAVKSKWTLDPYERRLITFLKSLEMNPDEFVAAAKEDHSFAEKKIMNYAIGMKARVEAKEITGATVGGSLKAIRLLLDMNDVMLNWKKIRRILPQTRRYALDRIPTNEELREIVQACDIRGKALTLSMMSGGFREGAIENFTKNDYSRLKKEGLTLAGKLVVYRNEPEQYTTFISPEACDALDRYVQFRQDNGETMGSNSPLFRDKFDPIANKYGHKKANAASDVIPMSGASVRKYYNRLLHSIGIRTEKRRRHEFSVHGFRKWFKTRSELAGMKPINVETLMGHSTGISDSYYRPTEADLLNDFLKAVDSLSILTETRIKADLEEAMKSRIEAEVRKQFEKAFNFVRQNPTLANVKPHALATKELEPFGKLT